MKRSGASPQTVAGLPRAASPLVSVIMTVYNGEKYLAEAIESILTQTFADFEFIIVDDGSQDGSVAIILDFAGRDGRIQLVQLEQNRGQANALNRGIADARGAYIALFDCDDISLPQRLQIQVKFLEHHPEIGVVGVGIQVAKKDLKPLHGWDYPQRHAFIVMNLCFLRNGFGGATVMMRRDVPASVRGYDPEQIVNDMDLYTRLIGKTRFANLRQRLYVYRSHERNMTKLQHEEIGDDWRDIHACLLNRLMGETPPTFTERIIRLAAGQKFSWRERRQLRRELLRLVEALITANAINEEDRVLLEAECARLLESATPRLWQMFLHWRRHRLGWLRL